jgi:protein SCO1/2
MHKGFIKLILFLILSVSIFPTVTASELQANPAGEKKTSENSDLKKREYFTDLKVLTQDREEVNFYTDVLKDNVVLINTIYINCPTISPTQSAVLSDLQTKLRDYMGRDIFFVSITVDPDRDTPEAFKEYASQFNAQKGWIFLTGKKENVDWILYKLGEYREDITTHSDIFILGNVKRNHWKRVRPYLPLGYLAEELIGLVEDKKR